MGPDNAVACKTPPPKKKPKQISSPMDFNYVPVLLSKELKSTLLIR